MTSSFRKSIPLDVKMLRRYFESKFAKNWVSSMGKSAYIHHYEIKLELKKTSELITLELYMEYNLWQF